MLKKLPLKADCFELDKDIVLLVEYDGNRHYSDLESVENDSRTSTLDCKWSNYGDGKHYMLRIPYFVQLDSRMNLFWFDKNIDLGDGFPQGFISKKCVLPNTYCDLGDIRTIKETLNLPQDVGLEIYDSILKKMEEKGSEKVISQNALRGLFIIFDKKRKEKIKTLEENNIWADNFYKRLDREGFKELISDIALSYIILDYCGPKKSQESIDEEMLAYDNFTVGYKSFMLNITDMLDKKGIKYELNKKI